MSRNLIASTIEDGGVNMELENDELWVDLFKMRQIPRTCLGSTSWVSNYDGVCDGAHTHWGNMLFSIPTSITHHD